MLIGLMDALQWARQRLKHVKSVAVSDKQEGDWATVVFLVGASVAFLHMPFQLSNQGSLDEELLNE